MFKQNGHISQNKTNEVTLVSYAAIAMEKYGSKKIPVLGVDVSKRSDIKEMILIHQNTPPGDCITQWSINRMNKKYLILSFKFERPSRIDFYIPLFFNLHSWVIEGILQSKVVVLKPITTQEKSMELLSSLEPSISVEIGAHEIPINWRKWQLKSIKKHLKNTGLSKKEVDNQSVELINSNKMFWHQHVDFDWD